MCTVIIIQCSRKLAKITNDGRGNVRRHHGNGQQKWHEWLQEYKIHINDAMHTNEIFRREMQRFLYLQAIQEPMVSRTWTDYIQYNDAKNPCFFLLHSSECMPYNGPQGTHMAKPQIITFTVRIKPYRVLRNAVHTSKMLSILQNAVRMP